MDASDNYYPFVSPRNHILVGQSGSGKTSFLQLICLANKIMFQGQVPKKIYIFYSVHQPIYEQLLEKLGDQIEFFKGLPTPEMVINLTSPKVHTCIMIDDMGDDSLKNEVVRDLFIKLGHHRNCSVWLVLHNLFTSQRFSRTVHLNCSYYHLFRNSRDKYQLKNLGRQLFPKTPNAVIDAYEELSKHNKSSELFHPLLIDLTGSSDSRFMLRSGYLPNDGQELMCYVIKK